MSLFQIIQILLLIIIRILFRVISMLLFIKLIFCVIVMHRRTI